MNGTGDREGRPYVGWVVTIVIAFLIVIPVRRFCIESYRISTNAMEDALHQGDYIVVNKLPLEGNPGRNKVVLFTSPLLKDTASNPLFLSRCIGMPGDTILVSGGGYEVNGKLLPHSPRSLNTCFITQKGAADFRKALQKLNIPLRNWKSETFGFSFSLTTFEEYQLREELTEEMNIHFIRSQAVPYKLVVPRKGRAYRLDDAALHPRVVPPHRGKHETVAGKIPRPRASQPYHLRSCYAFAIPLFSNIIFGNKSKKKLSIVNC